MTKQNQIRFLNQKNTKTQQLKWYKRPKQQEQNSTTLRTQEH